MVKLVESMPTTGDGLPVPVAGGVPGSGTVVDLELAASKARLQLLEGEAVGQWLEQQTALGVDVDRILTEYCDRMLMVDMGVDMGMDMGVMTGDVAVVGQSAQQSAESPPCSWALEGSPPCC